MQVRYIRKLMTSHMILDEQGQLSTWEEQMIAHTSLEHMLFAECITENGRNSLWYDITGKQSIDIILDVGTLQYELLCKLLMGIYQMVEQLESILLQADGLLLLPESIFIDYRTEDVYFCYYPGNEKSLSKAFEELMQYLLTKADHGDERVVELAYAVYERAAKGSGSLSELKELLCVPYEKDDLEEELEELKEKEIDHKESDDSFVEEKSKPEISEAEKCWSSDGNLLKRIAKKCTDYWKSHIKIRKKEQSSRRQFEEAKYVFEPEKETQQNLRPTVLLAELAKPPEGILRYEGKGLCKDLVIEGDIYMVGSEPECGGYIPSTTVSRKHAKITQKEGIYFIEDLNSSNGTYVGGEMLNYKTKVSLQKNEIVIFADEKFRFI